MDCKSSSLCIFDKPGALTDIQHRNEIEYYPQNAVPFTGPLEFIIPGSNDEYIDVSNFMLYLAFKIVHEDGTDIDQTKDIVGLNNLCISTLFSDASLRIGDTQVEGGSSDYAYRGYFRTVMQFTTAAQQSSMLAMCWYKDEAHKFDNATNTGFVKRKNLVGNSNVIEIAGPLFFDFFNQDRHLINNTTMRIKLTPNKPEFFLNSYSAATPIPKFKIQYENVILHAERLEMNPSVINGHALGLQTQNAQYYINHTDIMTFSVPKGQFSYIKDHLFPDLSPKMLMITLVGNEAFNGNIGKNPFNFQDYDLTKFALFRDGRSVPGVPFTPDFDNKRYLRSYIQTMKAFNYWNTDDSNGLKPNEWAGGYTIYAFDTTPDREAPSGCIHANVGNNYRLELNFGKALPETINVLIYAVSDSQIEITKLRDVITHYNR